MRKGDILMNLSTKILIGLGLGIIAGLELGAEGVDFAKTWIGPFGTIFMNRSTRSRTSKYGFRTIVNIFRIRNT